MLSLWFWVLLWLGSAYLLVRVVGKPIIEATRAQRAAEHEAAMAQAAAEAEAEAELLRAKELADLPPLWLLLEGLTPGLAAAELEERFGVPQDVELLGDEAERWRVPMRVEGEDGAPVSGLLLLDLQGGQLTSATFEPQDPPSDTEASVEASVSEAEPTVAG